MSHTMSIDLEMKDPDAVKAACDRLDIKAEKGTFELYGSKQAGLGIFLEGWQYPVVLQDDGTATYDNYGGHWGDIKKLNELKKYYGVERAKIEARRRGYSAIEGVNEAGQLQLRIRIGG